jgi:hypothetical protein
MAFRSLEKNGGADRTRPRSFKLRGSFEPPTGMEANPETEIAQAGITVGSPAMA